MDSIEFSFNLTLGGTKIHRNILHVNIWNYSQFMWVLSIDFFLWKLGQ